MSANKEPEFCIRTDSARCSLWYIDSNGDGWRLDDGDGAKNLTDRERGLAASIVRRAFNKLGMTLGLFGGVTT